MERLQQATLWLMQNAAKDPDNAGASAMDYLYIMAHTAMAYMWARIARVALDKLAAGEGDPQFYRNKLTTGRFYMERILPESLGHLEKLKSGAETMMTLDAEEF